MNKDNIKTTNSSKRCLILGGNGFIGSHLVDALIKQHTVTVFDKVHTRSQSKGRFIEGDFNNESDLARAVTGCDICFHLISTVLPGQSNLDPIHDIETNLLGSTKLLNILVKSGVKKIVFLSSGGTIYGLTKQLRIDENHPTNPRCSYGITKLAIEKYLHLYHELYGLDYAILRVSNAFGERQCPNAAQGAVAVFLGKALRNESIDIWGDGTVIRDYIYISDIIAALVSMLDYSGNEHIFNIGSGQGLSLNQILDNIALIIGRSVTRNYLTHRVFDVPYNVLSIERAKRAFNWQPMIPFLTGIKKMLCYYDIPLKE